MLTTRGKELDYRETIMASAVKLPYHALQESPNSRGITVYDWQISACTHPISNATELDAIQTSVDIPLPEMTFGSNVLELEHKPSGWKYEFNATGALKGVKSGSLEEGDGGVKVGYAEAWLKSRTGPNSSIPIPETSATKPYDWTYTTTYSGHSSPSSTELAWQLADLENESHTIPMAELTRQDPILFYAEIPLFEDELHDNGSSDLLVRIRVMPTCIFILARLTLRVDNVLFRIHDTRVFHSYSSDPPLVIRETSGWEAPYHQVGKHLPKRDDKTPLTDPTWIAQILTGLPKRISQSEGAGTGWRGMGTQREVLALPKPER